MHALPNTGFIGELSLNAWIRPVSGILPMVIKAKEANIDRLIVANENVEEAQNGKRYRNYWMQHITRSS